MDRSNFIRPLIDETKEYIVNRKLKKLSDGWVFPVAYREASFLSKVSNRDFAFCMFTDGERDLKIGITILKEGYFDKAIYNFQQSIEKAVKAILICFGIFKKTHFVGEILLREIEDKTLDDRWKEKLVLIAELSSEIEPEVTWSRYPGIEEDGLWIPYEEYEKDEANEIKEKCKEAIGVVSEFLAWRFK